MNLFQAAARGLPLSPASRALLKLLKGLLVSAVLAGVTAAYPLVVVGPGAAPNVGQAVSVFLVAFLLTLVNAAEKYLTAERLSQAPSISPPSSEQMVAAPSIGPGALAKGDGS